MIWQQAAWQLLEELQSNRLEVVKIKGLRVAISTNAEWYRRFCSRFVSGRKRYPRLRTIIKRQHTIRALEKIVAGQDVFGTTYGQRLLPFIEDVA